MKKTGYALTFAIAIASIGAADAADLPTKKATEAPKPNCFTSFWTWLDSSAADCPLTAGPITVYGTIDYNGSYMSSGAARSGTTDKPAYGIQKYSNRPRWQANYNGLSTSVIGLKLKQDLGILGAPGWSLVGVLEAGVNPYSGMFDNGPRSLVDNNTRATNGLTGKKNTPFQSTNLDSSRDGSWDNSQGYLGISNNTYGTLTFGRTNSLAYDSLAAYDPVSSVAFSLIGFSNSFPGFGDTETIRPNSALTYRLNYQNFRIGAQAQLGGYSLGNGSDGMYQGQVGADFPNIWGGTLSFDAIGSFAKDAVSLSSFSNSGVTCGPVACLVSINNQIFNANDVAKATLSNNIGLELLGKYKHDAWTVYGGYLYARLMNPSDDYAGGFDTIAQGISVPGGGFNSKGVFSQTAITSNNYNIQKVLMTWWGGAKYAVRPDLDVAFGYYFQSQNDFNTTACTGFGTLISSNKCAGGQQGLSVMADWRPWKRVDLYAGVMRSSVFGGLGNGFNNTVNWDPTAGVRVRF
jgi:predicted porin